MILGTLQPVVYTDPGHDLPEGLSTHLTSTTDPAHSTTTTPTFLHAVNFTPKSSVTSKNNSRRPTSPTAPTHNSSDSWMHQRAFRTPPSPPNHDDNTSSGKLVASPPTHNAGGGHIPRRQPNVQECRSGNRDQFQSQLLEYADKADDYGDHRLTEWLRRDHDHVNGTRSAHR